MADIEKVTTSKSTVVHTDANGNVVYKKTTESRVKYTSKQGTEQNVNTPVSDNITPKSVISSPASLNIIDIIRDYDWTYSAKSPAKLAEVPYIHLKEFKMLGNSYMTSLMTSALLFHDIAKSALDAKSPAANLFQKVKTSFKDNKFGKFMSEVGNSSSDLVNKLQEATKKATNLVKTQMESIDKTANAWGPNKQDLIDNYSYLYLRKPTNTEYKIPYFETNFFNIENSFQDSYSGGNKLAEGLFGEVMGAMKDLETLASSPVALSEPGMFIQRPKFYDFSETGYEITAKFYLFNTISENSYLKNLKLLTKLIVQNTPHRHNRLLVDPVCIYELTVPGRGFYPYAYISSLNVEHMGTKRILKGEKGNDIIVPDAFEVMIKLKSLTSDVNNFIIPETGTAGIDVSQRYGLGSIIKGMGNDSTKKTAQEPPPAKKQTEFPTPSRTVPMNTPSTALGKTSQPIRIAGGY